MFQFQVNYRDKVRQFYVNGVVSSYSEVVGEIVSNISSLFGCVFQIEYINDENIWITLSESDQDVQDLFRCSAVIPSADFRRVKLRIVEGCSPLPGPRASNKREYADLTNDHDDNFAEKKSRTKLSFKNFDQDASTEISEVYKTPIDLDIEEKEKSILEMDSYLETLQEQRTELTSKYTFPVNKQGKQCSRCHLYQNHRRNNCPNDLCVSAVMCGDLGKHAEESGEVRDIDNKIQKATCDIKKERIDLENKRKCRDKLMGSFNKQIELELINSDRKRYLIATPFGVKPKQALINEHVAILERHYHGKVPQNVAAERHGFKRIIENSLSKLPKKRVKYLVN